MNGILWGEIAGFATVITIILSIFFTLMKKWFLDLETYKADKEQANKNNQDSIERLEESEKKLMDEFREMLSEMQKEKANTEDLAKAEQRIEKLDAQISSIMTTVEKQCYRLDLLIETRGDMTELIKELRNDMTTQLKDLKSGIARQEDKVVTMQLDIQDLKTRLS